MTHTKLHITFNERKNTLSCLCLLMLLWQFSCTGKMYDKWFRAGINNKVLQYNSLINSYLEKSWARVFLYSVLVRKRVSMTKIWWTMPRILLNFTVNCSKQNKFFKNLFTWFEGHCVAQEQVHVEGFWTDPVGHALRQTGYGIS